jgi:hypothetical protein
MDNTKYAQHVIETGHEYGNMEETMKILHIEKKSRILNTYQRFHTYISKQNIQLNDTFTETYNPIYNTILTNFPSKKTTPTWPSTHPYHCPLSILPLFHLPNFQTTQIYLSAVRTVELPQVTKADTVE